MQEAERPGKTPCSLRTLSVVGTGNTDPTGASPMPNLPEFQLENHFAKWAFSARHHMTASDAKSMSPRDLLAMATPVDGTEVDDMWLGYTETCSAPNLRATPSTHFRLGSGRTGLAALEAPVLRNRS